MPSAQRHDAIFRALLGEPGFADGLIRRCLPEDVAALVPADTPFVAHERAFVDDTLRGTSADGVYSIRTRDDRTLFAILEHKSTPEARTPIQIAEYVLGVLRDHERREGPGGVAPLVIPIVVYHGPAKWTVPRSLSELSGRPGDPSRYELLDLVRIPYDELPPDDRVRGGLGILKNALVKKPSREDLRESLRDLRKRSPTLISRLVSYIVTTHQLSREVLNGLLREVDPELWETVMPTVAEEWKEEGRAQGWAEGKVEGWAEGKAEGRAEGKVEGRAEGKVEGRAEGKVEGRAEGKVEGRAEGKAETLLMLLERRFGAVPEDARTRILDAPVGDLDAWLDAFVSASSLDDVFGNGAIH